MQSCVGEYVNIPYTHNVSFLGDVSLASTAFGVEWNRRTNRSWRYCLDISFSPYLTHFTPHYSLPGPNELRD